MSDASTAIYPRPRSAKRLDEEKHIIAVRPPEARMSHAKTVPDPVKSIKAIEWRFARRWPCPIYIS
ncbi:MAG TPA: hypothetical protein VIL51_09510 [Thermoleophilia bacterium]